MKLGDKPRAYTAEDIIRRYNLDELKTDRVAIKSLNNGLTKTNGITEQYVRATLKWVIDNLVDQADIIAWFYNVAPTDSNEPAVNWTTTSLKQEHVGDLYYDTNTGYAYRYVYDEDNTIYKWERETDGDVINSLAIANAANDADDHKRRLFVNQPFTPYEVGDFWTNSDKILRCVIRRDSGNFNEDDWVDAGDYSDEDYEKQVTAIVDKYIEVVTTEYVSKVLLTTTTAEINMTVSLKMNESDFTHASIVAKINDNTSQVLIDADKINLTANDIINLIAGNTINLTAKNIAFSSTNYSVDTNGNMTCNNATINGTLEKTISGTGTVKVGKSSGRLIEFIFTSGNTDYYGFFYPNGFAFTKNNKYQSLVFDNRLELYDNNNNIAIDMNGTNGDADFNGKITAGNIDCGTCTLDTGSADIQVNFNKTFANPPKVVITPFTSTAGVIAPKVKSVTTTYFTATIGGSGFSNINCNWIAIE